MHLAIAAGDKVFDGGLVFSAFGVRAAFSNQEYEGPDQRTKSFKHLKNGPVIKAAYQLNASYHFAVVAFDNAELGSLGDERRVGLAPAVVGDHVAVALFEHHERLKRPI